MKMIYLYLILTVGIVLVGGLTVLSKNEPLLEKGIKEIGYFVYAGENNTLEDLEPVVSENIDINYKNKNMTIEFKEGETILGQVTLKSHKTYDEIRKITTGKNKTVVWYNFSDFKDDSIGALKGVEFIDMREMIENKSYTQNFDDFEKMDESKILIDNPNYLLPVEKNYTFVYQKNSKWLPYNSLDIPKENILIGVQTDLFGGELIDVIINIFNNKLDRHSVVLGTNVGFLEESPTGDTQDSSTNVDDYSYAIRDTSPATAITITEVGFYAASATQEANFEVGLYNDGVNNEPEDRIYVDDTNAKGTEQGWKKVTVDWEISPDTVYWIAVQVDDTATPTNIDYDLTNGAGLARGPLHTLTLGSDWGTSSWKDTDGLVGIYAVWEGGAADSCTCPASPAEWTIINGDECSLDSVCEIYPYHFRVLDGRMSILSGGYLRANGCYVKDGESLFIEESGGLYCES